MPREVCLRIGLVIEVRSSDQKIHKVRTCLATVKCKPTVKFRIGMNIDLVNVRLEADLYRVLSDHPTKVIAPGIGIVRLRKICNGSSHNKAKRAEIDIFNAFDGRSQWENALAGRRSRRRATGKALRSETWSDSSGGLPHVVIGAHIAQMQLVHTRRTEGFHIADINQLRGSQIQAAESGDRRPPLPSRKRVVH